MSFSEIKPVRFSEQQHKEIQEVIDNYPEIYMNYSHFVRVAVIRLLRRHRKKRGDLL